LTKMLARTMFNSLYNNNNNNNTHKRISNIKQPPPMLRPHIDILFGP